MPALMRETILVITPFMLSGVILNLTTSLNQTIYYRIMIGVRGLDEMSATTLYGIFSNKAVVISNIPISIATAVASAIIPGLSAAYARRDLEDTRRRAENAIRMTAMIAIPSAAGLILLSRPITMLMFPQQESLPMASALLSLVGVTVVFYSIGTITNAVLQSIGRMNMPLVSAGIALVIQTVALTAALYVSDIGIYVLALVSILYSALIFLVNEMCLRRYLGTHTNYRKVFLQPAGYAIVMGLVARIVYQVIQSGLAIAGLDRAYYRNLFAALPAILVAVLVYAFLMVRTGTMTREDLLSLPRGGSMVRLFTRLHWLR